MTGKCRNVLFLCTGNSARSILAEAILNRIGADRFRAFSAGSQPKGKVHPHAIGLLAGLDYETKDLRSKSWGEYTGPDAPPLSFVFTLCDSAASEACPVWFGAPMTAHWGLPDPAAATGDEAVKHAAFAEAYRVLHRRLEEFCGLPIDSLGTSNLKQRLSEIGLEERSGLQA